MAKLKALSKKDVVKGLAGLEGWRLSKEALRCEFRFESFKKALQFVNTVAGMAEAANHHPDIDIRYSLVKLALSTHDVGGISKKDFQFARAVDQLSSVRKSV